MNLDDNDKKYLLGVARNVIENLANKKSINMPESYSDRFDADAGAFCTITKKENGTTIMQEYVGIPYPLMPMMKAVINAARAAYEDHRYPDIKPEELDKIKIELAILGEPRIIMHDPWNYPKVIDPRNEGLMLHHGPYSSLLLPNTVRENNWSKEECLNQLCLKAGLPVDTWNDSRAKIRKFSAQVFGE
ncbi:MAG: TIGR00296 family protein [Candidatus Aenigmatarchaeota archaeon]